MLEISNPILWKNKKNNIKLSSAEFAERMIKVNKSKKIEHVQCSLLNMSQYKEKKKKKKNAFLTYAGSHVPDEPVHYGPH